MTREQACWYDMVYRCTRPDHKRYKDYGAKGIKVYEGWLGEGGREAFTEHMGPRPEGQVLGRLDMSGDYVPGNVAWMTRSEARRLQKNTVKVDTADGPVAAVTLAEKAGKSPRNVRRRLVAHGWSPKEALGRDLPKYRKLTGDQAIAIFGRARAGESCQDLAIEYGVSLNLIYEIRRGEKWGAVTGVPVERSEVAEGQYGVVLIESGEHAGTFGYYDDDDCDDEVPGGVVRIVYPGTPFATGYVTVEPKCLRTVTEHEEKGWTNRYQSG